MTRDETIASIPGLLDLWSETTGDPRVVVAVLDGPVDRAHPSLARAHLETIESAAPVVPRPDGPATRHGTLVASLIFGRHEPESPVWGMAPGCRGLVVPVFGDDEDPGSVGPGPSSLPQCSQLDLARGILLAIEHGARIVNISGGRPMPAASAEPILVGAVDRALRRGILVVAAAGNDGWRCAHVPAALPGVLAVGARDAPGRPTDSSDRGGVCRPADLLAPGIGWLGARAGGGTAVVAGTSYATAIVSGAAALIASLALRRGRRLDGARIRRILLDSARESFDDPVSGRRRPAGRLDLITAGRWLRARAPLMSDEFPVLGPSPGAARPAIVAEAGSAAAVHPIAGVDGRRAIPTEAPSAPDTSRSIDARPVTPPEGCDCASCQAKATAATTGLVFALGQVGYDLVSEARRDSIQQHMGGAGPNPADPARMLDYLEDNPWEAASILWTLNSDQTPLYAIAPAGPFAGKVYELLREFLADQVNDRVELVSIPGRLAGRARLLNGQVVPAVVPEPRGMYSWTTGALVRAAGGESPPDGASADGRAAHAARAQGVRGFLDRVYHELRNLGLTAEDRALNYAATNAFQVEKIFESAIQESMELDTIEVERSPIARPDSDCWDVKIHFFYLGRPVQTVRKVFRFTVDVSDVVPVTVGPTRSWFVR
jgi:cyanobactin maturation PatA/PatG family protease